LGTFCKGLPFSVARKDGGSGGVGDGGNRRREKCSAGEGPSFTRVVKIAFVGGGLWRFDAEPFCPLGGRVVRKQD